MRTLAIQSTSVFERYGGIEYYLDDLLAAASSTLGKGSVLAVIPRRGAFREFRNRPYEVEAVTSAGGGWPRRVQNRLPYRLFGAALATGRRFRPEIIVSGHVSLGPTAYLLSKLLGVPYVSVVYGIDCWGAMLPLDEWCLKKARRIISISHWTQERLEERGYLKTQFQVIHPIISSDLENQTKPPPEKRPFTLLTVSRLDSRERYKGHDDVLEALLLLHKSAREFQYIIQGSGDDLNRLKAKARSLNLEKSVQFVDSVHDRAELRKLYSKADLFVMPSRYGKWGGRWRGEGFGIVYAEAGALGVPSLAYRCGGAVDIIDHGKSGFLVEPNSIAELSKTIAHCMDHPGDLARLGENARLRVNSLFTKAQMIRSISKLYESLRQHG